MLCASLVAACSIYGVRRRHRARACREPGRTGDAGDASSDEVWRFLEHQAGGRCAQYGEAGFLVSPDGSLVLKPLQSRGRSERELAFLESVRRRAALQPLARWVPRCRGVREVRCAMPGTVCEPARRARGIVMDNILVGMRRPCVLDAKLGAATCAAEACDEKQARSRLLHGALADGLAVRLSGLRVYRAAHSYYQAFDKYSLRQLDPGSLPLALRWFLDAGYVHLRTDVVPAVVRQLRALADDVARAPVRLVCSSVVVAYEGEPPRTVSVAEGRAWRVPDPRDPVDVRVALIDFPYAEHEGSPPPRPDASVAAGLRNLADLFERTAAALEAAGKSAAAAWEAGGRSAAAQAAVPTGEH